MPVATGVTSGPWRHPNDGGRPLHVAAVHPRWPRQYPDDRGHAHTVRTPFASGAARYPAQDVSQTKGYCWRIPSYAARAAKRETRVGASGRLANHAAMRSTLKAAAMATFCNVTLTSPR